MSRKNKTLRAFLHQNQSPTIEQAWDAAWKHAQKTFHARSMQDMEKQIADLQAECEKLVEALERKLHDIASEVVSCGCGHVTASLREMAMAICAEKEPSHDSQ